MKSKEEILRKHLAPYNLFQYEEHSDIKQDVLNAMEEYKNQFVVSLDGYCGKEDCSCIKYANNNKDENI